MVVGGAATPCGVSHERACVRERIVTGAGGTAWYVYAVVPGAATLPNCRETIVPGARLCKVGHATRTMTSKLAALVSPVPRALFAQDDPESRTGEPDWVAERAAAHHGVVAALSLTGPCVPLGFSTVFASTESLRTWLMAQEAGLLAALAFVSGRDEFAATLIEDETAHEAWLEDNENSLVSLRRETDSASPGVAFLLVRRFEKLRRHMRATHCAQISAKIAERFRDIAQIRAEEPRAGAIAAWSLLMDRGSDGGTLLRSLGLDLVSTGISLRVTGPWPPYAFARAAWHRELP